MQTCLEKIGVDRRPIDRARNDYYSGDEYSKDHKDALSDGDSRGMGTGHPGHGHYTPDCTKAIMTDNGVVSSPIDYSNFDTNNGGNSYDINGREGIPNSGRNALLNINNYNRDIAYGKGYVTINVRQDEGQYINNPK